MLIILKTILCLTFLNAYSIDNNNSIYKMSFDARSNSMGSLHLLTDNVNGIFSQMINLKGDIQYNSFYSNTNLFDNSVRVFQFGYCFKHDNEKNISFGILRRSIEENYNTHHAWHDLDNDGPDFSEINYSDISSFADHEIGFLFSINKKITPTSSMNLKFKPSYHSILDTRAYGLGLDLLLYKRINKLNLIFGFEDIFSHKKWDNGTVEYFNMNIFSNLTASFEKLLLSFEINHNLEYKYGCEYEISDTFNLRIGKNEFNDISVGLGIKTEVVDFNYAYLETGETFTDYISQFSLIFKFNGLKKVFNDFQI